MNHHCFHSIAAGLARTSASITARTVSRTPRSSRNLTTALAKRRQLTSSSSPNPSTWLSSSSQSPLLVVRSSSINNAACSTSPVAPQNVRHFTSTTVAASAHAPMSFSDLSTRKKVTINTLRKLYEKGEPISMVTAHDFPSGLAGDQSGADMVLVGDSLAMVCLGMEDTNQITLDEMIHHCRAVARGVKSAFIVGDLPMGSYELSPEQALTSSIAMIQRGRASAVKLEGGREMADTVRRLTTVGIPVLGHVGLTPQRQSSLGGFVVQSKTSSAASRLLTDALALQDAGVFAMVIEAVPAEIAEMVTKVLDVPTIGIGAGNGTSGQVLVQVDMLGMFPAGRFMPKFVKRYENLFEKSTQAMAEYTKEVKSRAYPVAGEHTYPVKKEVVAEFEKVLESRKVEIEESKRRRREEMS